MKITHMQFLSLSSLSMVLTCGLVSCSQQMEAENYTDVQFDSTQLYSRLMIESRINDFYANKNQMGFNVYDEQGNLVKKNAGGSKLKFDYVPGLVAKALIEGAAYYKDSTFARPWFYTVENYANTYVGSVPTTGESLDNLNAAKMYAYLYDLTDEGGAYAAIADASTHSNALKAMQKAQKGLTDANNRYVIKASVKEDAAGGWFHKSGYPNQMWCDGQYMGPALLGLLQKYDLHIGDNDWATSRQGVVVACLLGRPNQFGISLLGRPDDGTFGRILGSRLWLVLPGVGRSGRDDAYRPGLCPDSEFVE